MFTPNIHYLFFLSWNPHIFFHMQIRLHLMLSPRRFYAGATDWVEDILLMERFFFSPPPTFFDTQKNCQIFAYAALV